MCLKSRPQGVYALHLPLIVYLVPLGLYILLLIMNLNAKVGCKRRPGREGVCDAPVEGSVNAARLRGDRSVERPVAFSADETCVQPRWRLADGSLPMLDRLSRSSVTAFWGKEGDE